MSDLEQMLTRQAEWQKNRQSLTWPEKIRMAEALQRSLRQLRNSSDRLPHTPEDSQKPRKPESA